MHCPPPLFSSRGQRPRSKSGFATGRHAHNRLRITSLGSCLRGGCALAVACPSQLNLHSFSSATLAVPRRSHDRSSVTTPVIYAHSQPCCGIYEAQHIHSFLPHTLRHFSRCAFGFPALSAMSVRYGCKFYCGPRWTFPQARIWLFNLPTAHGLGKLVFPVCGCRCISEV